LISPWTKLLEVVSAETAFTLPSYVERLRPIAEEHPKWGTTDLDQRTIIDRLIEETGRRREDLTDMDWQLLRQIEKHNQSDLKNPMFEHTPVRIDEPTRRRR